MRTLKYDISLELIKQLKSDGNLSLYIFLCSLKGAQSQDEKLSLADFKKAHLTIGYSKNSTRVYLNKLIKLGWAHKSKTKDFYLISLQKIAAQYTLNIKNLKYVKGKNNKELLARVGCLYLVRLADKQIFKAFGKKTATQKNSIVRRFDDSHSIGVSVKYLADLLGFQSNHSGTRYFQEMVRLKLIARKRVNDIVCPLIEFNPQTMKHYENRIWLCKKTQMIMERKMSQIKFIF